MDPVEDYIYGFEGSQREILQYFHDLMLSFPGITARMSYKIPFYYGKSWICYLSPVGKDAVDLGFPRGNELSNEQTLLEEKGRKLVRTVRFKQLVDIPEQAIHEILQEAILLDETIPYSGSRYF